jgi:hypothetical protein
MKQKFAEKGYEIPNVTFWNVQSRNNIFHAKSDIPGVQLVSGQSVSTFKTVLDGIGKTAFQVMLETLEDPIYNSITV